MSITEYIIVNRELAKNGNAMRVSPLVTLIRQRMDEQNMTQLELSRRSRVPNSTLERLLSGEVQEPKPSVLFRIAKPLDVSYKRLMVLAGYPIDEPDTSENQDRRLVELAAAFPWLVDVIEDLPTLRPSDREMFLAYLETIRRQREDGSQQSQKER